MRLALHPGFEPREPLIPPRGIVIPKGQIFREITLGTEEAFNAGLHDSREAKLAQMLILDRNQKERKILIGEDVLVTYIESGGNQTRLCINAPKSVKILRKELTEKNNQGNPENNLPTPPSRPPDITITMVKINPYKIAIGITADRSIPINRTELLKAEEIPNTSMWQQLVLSRREGEKILIWLEDNQAEKKVEPSKA